MGTTCDKLYKTKANVLEIKFKIIYNYNLKGYTTSIKMFVKRSVKGSKMLFKYYFIDSKLLNTLW